MEATVYAVVCRGSIEYCSFRLSDSVAFADSFNRLSSSVAVVVTGTARITLSEDSIDDPSACDRPDT
jgi:hypothetical protein